MINFIFFYTSQLLHLGKSKSNTDHVRLLKQGDLMAFDAIYEKYCERLFGFVLQYIKQENDAEGIVQEVFIKIWESREKIDTSASFETFLFTIAYNTTINLLRKRINEQKYLEHLKNRQQILHANQIIDEIHYRELNQQVAELLKQLSPRQKEIYLLSREQGLTHEEIAQKLQISPNTVKNHLVSVLAFLRSKLDTGLVINALFLSLFL
mgnify:CR=1 FL=1